MAAILWRVLQKMARQEAWIVRSDSFGCVVPGCQLLGVGNPSNMQPNVQVYPNPAQNELTVECLNPILNPTEICIYNTIGVQKDCFFFENELKIVIPLYNYSESIYYYSCSYPNGKSQIGKFIIIR